MPKIDKIVSLLMSGDMDSAADKFVDNLFAQVNGIEPEIVTERIARSDVSIIRGESDDGLEAIYGALEQVWDAEDEGPITSSPSFIKFFADRAFVPTDIRGDYVGELMDAIADELDSRDDGTKEDPLYNDMDDFRDFDEEDRNAAWDDKYQAFKNEY